MNQDAPYQRSQLSSQQAPRAPPLPPLRRARDAASRFLGYQSQPSNGHLETRPSRSNVLLGRYATLSPTQDATGYHRTGLEINTLAINERGSHALIGGKEIFKTIRIDDGYCTEDFNLRTAIRSNPHAASGQPRNTYSIDIADVAWAKGDCGDFVAAATSSGKIIVYDLGHAGLQAAQLHEHFRQVHKVTFNPHKGSLLLSGSQDGTVRLWDIRDVRNQASALQSKRKFSGQSDGVRDVKWSPTEGLDFAFGTDTGEIQRWDMRNLKHPKVKVTAHNLACNAVDWHPDGIHILGCSFDRTVRVFDFSSTQYRAPKWEIRAPFPVMNCRWRPSCESVLSPEQGARQCTQIVTSYDQQHAAVHIWDFRRPAIPFREIVPNQTAPTDLTWHSQDLLWTVGREGAFLQTDIQHAAKVIDKRNLQAIDVSPLGELGWVAQSRRRRRASKQKTMPTLQTNMSGASSTSPETSFLSRSWADDGLDHTFLSVAANHRELRSPNGNRGPPIPQLASSQSQSSARRFTINFDEVMNHRISFQPHQAACRGSFPSMNSALRVTQLAKGNRIAFDASKPDQDIIAHMEKIFAANAAAAYLCGASELAKTWKIAGLSTVSHLKERIQTKQKRALEKFPAMKAAQTAHTALESLATRLLMEKSKSPTHSPMSMYPVSSLAQHLAAPESTSNVPTPLARPTTTSNRVPKEAQPAPLPDVDTDDHIELPPSLAHSAPGPLEKSSRPDALAARKLTVGNLKDLQKLASNRQSSERENMERWWNTNPKLQSDIGAVADDLNAITIPPRLEKHDSDESFKFLEGSTDSRGPSFPASLSSEASAPLEMVAERPSRMDRDIRQSSLRHDPFPNEHRQTSASQTLLFDGSGTLADSENDSSGEPAILASQRAVAHVWRDHERSEDLNGGPRAEEKLNRPIEYINSARPASQAPPPTTLAPKTAPGPAPTAPATKIATVSHNHLTSGTTVSPPNPVRRDSRTHTVISPYAPEADLDLESHKPWTLLSMLQELLHFYTVSEPHPQTAATLLLLLSPLLPRTHPLPNEQIYRTISTSVDTFFRLNWPHDDIPTLIADNLLQPTKAGLNPIQIEAVLATYHDQCVQYQLHDTAALLRNLSYPAYPAVYEDSLKDNSVHIKCGRCAKPMPLNSATSSLKCTSCHTRQAPCPICQLQRSPFDDSDDAAVEDSDHEPLLSSSRPPYLPPSSPSNPPLTLSLLWTSCLLCNHSGHFSCYKAWFQPALISPSRNPTAPLPPSSTSASSCPHPGCLCDCVPGPWRSHKTQWLAEHALRERQTRRATHHLSHHTAPSQSTLGLPLSPVLQFSFGSAGAATAAAAAANSSGSTGAELPLRDDVWRARESRAVEGAREVLMGGGGTALSGPHAVNGSRSSGRGSAELEGWSS